MEILREIINISIKKVANPWQKTIVLSLLAGFFISFGGQFYTSVITGESEILGVGLTKLIGGMVFSIGLVFVVSFGAELFTGNNMIITLGALSRKLSLKMLLKNWTLVYLGNFAGALIFVALIYFSGVDKSGEVITPVGQTAMNIANAKVSSSFLEILIKGILANWLVCLAIMLSLHSKNLISKIAGCMFPISAFIAMGYDHSVANMFFLPIGFFVANGSIATLTISAITKNLVAATIGNIIGGVVFNAIIFWYIHKKSLQEI